MKCKLAIQNFLRRQKTFQKTLQKYDFYNEAIIRYII